MKKSAFHKYLGLIAFVMVFALAACGNYARLRLSPDEAATVDHLVENWDAYHIYYSGFAVDNLSGIMFDPKDNDRVLVPSERWGKIKDKKSVSDAIGWVKTHDFPGYYPRLYRILGPDGAFYGYLFTSYHHVYAKQTDERTLFVYDLPEPPYYEGNGDRKLHFGVGL